MTQKWENRRYERRWLKTRLITQKKKESFTFCHFLIIAHHKLSMRKEYLQSVSFRLRKFQRTKDYIGVIVDSVHQTLDKWQDKNHSHSLFLNRTKKGRHLMKKKVILLNSSSLSLHPFSFLSLLSSSSVLARCLRDQLRIVIGYNDLSNLTKVKQKTFEWKNK